MIGGFDTTDSIQCGACGTLLTPTPQPLLFVDCAVLTTHCPHCKRQILLTVATPTTWAHLLWRQANIATAERFTPLVLTINNRGLPQTRRRFAVKTLRGILLQLADDAQLSSMTQLFTSTPTEDNVLGFETRPVDAFIRRFKARFPPAFRAEEIELMSADWVAQHQRRLTLSQAALDAPDDLPSPLNLVASAIKEKSCL